MRLERPLAFVVTHSGRGGAVTCRSQAGELSLAIELESGGAFTVWLRGAGLVSPEGKARRLEPDDRRLLYDELRAFLDSTGRERWAIEPRAAPQEP
jgi:hypothetical protein